MKYANSRHRLAALAALCLLAAGLLIWLDHSPVRPGWRAEPKTEEQRKGRDFEKYHAKVFSVVNVVDGDTIDIDVPDGKYDHTRIRLWGIDTPETKSTKYGVMYFGPEAAEFAAKLALGRQVTVYLEGRRTRDKYGRLLAYVLLPEGGFLNEVLVAEGFAYADLRFRHSFYYRYKRLESVARSQNKGLWQDVTRAQLPEWLQRERPTLLK
jgi:endonuclease YncB( thermonuclease family)